MFDGSGSNWIFTRIRLLFQILSFFQLEKKRQNACFLFCQFLFAYLLEYLLESSASNSLAWRSHGFNLESWYHVRETGHLWRLLGSVCCVRSVWGSWCCFSRSQWRRLNKFVLAINLNKKKDSKIFLLDCRCLFETFQTSQISLSSRRKPRPRLSRNSRRKCLFWRSTKIVRHAWPRPVKPFLLLITCRALRDTYVSYRFQTFVKSYTWQNIFF